MRTSALLRFALAAAATVGSATLCGCGSPADTNAANNSDDYEFVGSGKEDNYRSTSAREFVATSTLTVVLDEADAALPEAERLKRAEDLVSAKLLQVGWFLNLWVSDKEPEDSNKDYGSFHAMARNSSVKSLAITAVDARTYRFQFEATIAGQNSFLSLVGGVSKDGGKLVDLNMGKVSNSELLSGTWQSRYGVHSWKPSLETADKLEIVPTLIKESPRSSNAFLNYKELYKDKQLLVGAQFGFDYNSGRQDLANARQLYFDLLDRGFQSPVAKYEDLKLDSAPLSRTSIVDGETVDVSVKLVHPGMVADPGKADDAKKLRDALLDLLAHKEVVLFNGHAGVSGRLLPGNFQATSAGNILPDEYPKLALYDGFQIFLIEGCQTYARFTDGFRQNPAKRGPNGELVKMDIVTSTSYTWTSQGAEAMEAILFPLVGESETKPVKAVSWDDVLRVMNAAPSSTAFMGVNGIDNDPHAHPFANAENLGKSCTSSTSCGGDGNLCVKKSSASTQKICATVCIDDAGCPSTHRCNKVASNNTINSKACVAR